MNASDIITPESTNPSGASVVRAAFRSALIEPGVAAGGPDRPPA
jgi:hypothetical protein